MKLVIFVLVLFRLQTGESQCSGNDFGVTSPNSRSGSEDSNANTNYILLGNNGYEINCCGVATDWLIFSSAAGTVYFQIWRPSGSGYELVGENIGNIGGTGLQSVAVAVGNRISVRSGDRFGWYASGTNVVEHKGVGGPDNTIEAMAARPSQGDIEDWTGATVESGREYAIRLTVGGGTPPTFDSPADGSTYSIINDVSVGHLVETITWSDSDIGDSLTVTMDTSTTKFSFTSGTGELTVASALSGATVTDTLDFTVEDLCGNKDSLSIDVTIVNEPPVIHNLPASGTLSEDTTVQTLLFTINATDSGGTVYCDFDASVPNTYPFSVLQVPTTSDWGIYSDANPSFDYDVINQYPLAVVCDDGSENSNTETFYLYLEENQPPVIHNLQGATTLSTSSSIGTNVFTVNATDNEGDTLTFTMSPSSAPFNIFASGQIQLNQDISSYTTTGYDLEITVSDGRNTVGPKILTVIIQDINDPVLISNLPLTSYSVPENTALSSSIFTVSISDQDTQTWTYSMSSTPGTGLSYFSLDSNSGLITTSGTVLDYETLSAAGTTSFTFTVTVNDGIASDTDLLVIDVINVNEAPAFGLSSYSLSTSESPAGTVIGTPAFGVTDPDSGDSYTYMMDCGTDTPYFLMDTTTGEVSFQSEYDADAGLATTVTCNVMVEDTGTLTDTATLSIYISDINDNTPVFAPATYSFFISYYASAGTVVGTVTATDGDTGSFGTLTYTLDQSSLFDEYFAVDNTGQIRVQKTPNGNPIGYSTSVTVNVTATDGGGQSDIASVTIVISDTTTTSTTTSTDRFKIFIEDGRNVAWLVASLVILAISGGVVTWLACTCRGDNSCRAFKRNLCKKGKRSWHSRQKRDFSRLTPRTHHPASKIQHSVVTVRQPPPPKHEQAWRSSAGV